jgi:hypothetical protein
MFIEPQTLLSYREVPSLMLNDTELHTVLCQEIMTAVRKTATFDMRLHKQCGSAERKREKVCDCLKIGAAVK